MKNVAKSLEFNTLKELTYPSRFIRDESIKPVKFERFNAPNFPFVLSLLEHEAMRQNLEENLGYC